MRRRRTLLVLAVLGATAGGCLESPATYQARQIASLYQVAMVLAAGVFVVVWGLLTWSVLRYRRRKHAAGAPVQTRGNMAVEVVWTVIPALLVAGLFGLTIVRLDEIQALSADPGVRLSVDAFRWGWTFRFPDRGVTVTGYAPNGPEIELPVGQTIEVRLTGDDVIHAFYVPAFLAKYDAIPGREHVFPLLIEQPGTYAGQCAEFCGILHSQMPFTIDAVSSEEFETWIERVGGASPGPVTPSGPGDTP